MGLHGDILQKNLNFGTKLILILVASVIVSLGTMIFFTTKKQYENAEKQLQLAKKWFPDAFIYPREEGIEEK